MDTLLSTLGVIAIGLVIILVLVVLFLIFMLVRKHRQVHQQHIPVSTKVAYWLSLVYTVFPVDLLPDPVYFDDIVVLISGLIYVNTSLRRQNRRQLNH